MAQARMKSWSDLPVSSFRQLWSEFPVCIRVWRAVAVQFPQLKNNTHVLRVLHACLALIRSCDGLSLDLNVSHHVNDYFTECMQTVSKLFVIPVISCFPDTLFAAFCFPFLFHSSLISVWPLITESVGRFPLSQSWNVKSYVLATRYGLLLLLKYFLILFCIFFCLYLCY